MDSINHSFDKMKLSSISLLPVLSNRSIFIASILLLTGCIASAETLSGYRATALNESDFPEYSTWDFQGIPVKSYYKVDRAYFTLSDEYQLFVHRQKEFNGDLASTLLQSNVVEAAVGYDYLLYVKSDGTLWKRNLLDGGTIDDGFDVIISDPELIAENVASVCSGRDHYLLIKSDGSLWGAGYNAGDGRFGFSSTAQDIETPILIANNVKSVKAGHGFTLYLLADYSLWGMGNNDYGQLGTGSFESVVTPRKIAENVKKIGAEINSSWFIDNNDALYFMGRHLAGPIGIAEGAQSAAVVPSNSGIYENYIFVLMKKSNELLVGQINQDPEHRNWGSWGTQVKGIVACNTGVFSVKKGTPVARYTVPNSTTDGTPLAAPFDKMAAGSSFMTINSHEDQLARNRLSRDYTTQRVLRSSENGAKPVYRFLNKTTFNHIHTLSSGEIDALRNNPAFVQEGVAFYAYETEFEGTVPVHRFFMPKCNGYYYAIGDNRKDHIQQNYSTGDFAYEGIAWYAYSFFGK